MREAYKGFGLESDFICILSFSFTATGLGTKTTAPQVNVTAVTVQSKLT